MPDKQKYFEDQLDDEEVLFVFRKHPIVMRRGFIYSSIGMLAGPLYSLILTYVRPNDPPSLNFFYGSLIASLLVAIILFIPSWITWYYSVFIVTDQRLIQISQKGFWNRSVVDIGLPQIQMVNYEISGFQETMLGFGTIMMQTFVGDLVIHEVHKPAEIQKKILGILREKGILSSSPPMVQSEES